MMSRLSISVLISASIGCSMLLASCGTSRSSNASVYKTTPAGNVTKPDRKTFEIPSSLAPQSHALLTEAKRWIGTPYRYGGEDRNGVDCSGLVLNVYRSALQLKLPRNSAQQASFCRPISKTSLMPGDLIFFDTSGGGGKKISHVGIYVGDGMMVHSSSSKGVIVSDINADYFRRTFAGAGYVEKYRNMIASNSPSQSPAQKPQQTSAPESQSTPTASPAKDEPFTLSPVSNLPSRKTAPAKTGQPKSATSQQQPRSSATQAITPVTSGTVTDEPTPEEARKKVLNSIIEQKLDSIFNR
ncbi:MAG: C40 family peptidase [Duncaniella sp.]|uniref:C40 family peptidase n=1 Tax=Duncaniella sp. TaxID=2518496 RepID=UPI0023D495CB|nr:NlpC/P60 family protein [Duncaniella sp.]MDE5988538.1 C40 family peptidase [Duncaniella sp.]